jgi:hypothetical protein
MTDGVGPMVLLAISMAGVGALMGLESAWVASQLKFRINGIIVIFFTALLCSAIHLYSAVVVSTMVRGFENGVTISHETVALLALGVPAVVLAQRMGLAHRNVTVHRLTPETKRTLPGTGKPTWAHTIPNMLPAISNIVVCMIVKGTAAALSDSYVFSVCYIFATDIDFLFH